MKHRAASPPPYLITIVCITASFISQVCIGSVTTDFEDVPNPSADFTIGASPETARFNGDAFAGSAGVGELYRSGVQAWMVDPNGIGRIAFETNASSVDFFARTRSIATGDTIIKAFNDFGNVIGQMTIPAGAGWTHVIFIGSINHIRVTNNDAVHMNGIDDFTFTPEQATVANIVAFRISKGTHIRGGKGKLRASDNRRTSSRAKQGNPTQRLTMRVDLNTNVANPSSIDIAYEGSINDPGGKIKIFLRNFRTGSLKRVKRSAIGRSEMTFRAAGLAGSKYVDANGTIQMVIKISVAIPSNNEGFLSKADLVQAIVR